MTYVNGILTLTDVEVISGIESETPSWAIVAQFNSSVDEYLASDVAAGQHVFFRGDLRGNKKIVHFKIDEVTDVTGVTVSCVISYMEDHTPGEDDVYSPVTEDGEKYGILGTWVQENGRSLLYLPTTEENHNVPEYFFEYVRNLNYAEYSQAVDEHMTSTYVTASQATQIAETVVVEKVPEVIDTSLFVIKSEDNVLSGLLTVNNVVSGQHFIQTGVVESYLPNQLIPESRMESYASELVDNIYQTIEETYIQKEKDEQGEDKVLVSNTDIERWNKIDEIIDGTPLKWYDGVGTRTVDESTVEDAKAVRYLGSTEGVSAEYTEDMIEITVPQDAVVANISVKVYAVDSATITLNYDKTHAFTPENMYDEEDFQVSSFPSVQLVKATNAGYQKVNYGYEYSATNQIKFTNLERNTEYVIVCSF